MRVAGTALVTTLLALAAASAGAQTAEKNELSVFGGISLMDASTTEPSSPYILAAKPVLETLIYPPIFGTSRTLDGSGEFGVRYGRDVTEAMTLTGDFSIAPAHELAERFSYGCPEPLVCIAAISETSVVAPEYLLSERIVAYHWGGGLRLNVLPGALKPAVIAGIGGVTFAGTSHRETQFALRVGGSLTASVRNLTTTIEILDAIIADHYVTNRVEHDVHIRIAFGVRW